MDLVESRYQIGTPLKMITLWVNLFPRIIQPKNPNSREILSPKNVYCRHVNANLLFGVMLFIFLMMTCELESSLTFTARAAFLIIFSTVRLQYTTISFVVRVKSLFNKFDSAIHYLSEPRGSYQELTRSTSCNILDFFIPLFLKLDLQIFQVSKFRNFICSRVDFSFHPAPRILDQIQI